MEDRVEPRECLDVGMLEALFSGHSDGIPPRCCSLQAQRSWTSSYHRVRCVTTFPLLHL